MEAFLTDENIPTRDILTLWRYSVLFFKFRMHYKRMVVSCQSATVNQPGHRSKVLTEHECELKVAWRWNAATNDRG